MTDIDMQLVAQIAGSLTDMQRRALGEMDRFYGKGPASLAADLDIPVAEAREILKFFRQEGIVDYGPLYDEDRGELCGRGYWIDRFGEKVREAAFA